MSSSALQAYISGRDSSEVNEAFVAYLANLSQVARVTPDVARLIVNELADQRSYLKLIASENYCSLSAQMAMGNLLTDKYAEGFPHHRFYEGCDNVDQIEAYACEQARRLFGTDHAYVQPHSGADANLIAYWAILTAKVETPALEALGVRDPTKLDHAAWNTIRAALGNQRLLGMDYYSGGHLTHGYRRNLSAKMFEAFTYAVNPETGFLDYDDIERLAVEIRPLILLAGYSSYPRAINFRRMREIADKVGAVFMVDMAHFSGLVAGGVFQGDTNPLPFAHILTSTSHKTLRGPRGGLILCNNELGEYVDKGCPLVIGGPLPNMMASKAVCFTEANTPEFKDYAHKIVANARALAAGLTDQGLRLATGGTDNHLMLIDVHRSCGLTGRQAAAAMYECGITLNFNSLPFDPNGPLITSGLRVGTPAVTTLGMGEPEMKEIAAIIKRVLEGTRPALIASGQNAGQPSKSHHELDKDIRDEARGRVHTLLQRYPVYPCLDLAFMQKHFS